MKKIVSLVFFALLSITAQAQRPYTIESQLKLKTIPVGEVMDSLVTINDQGLIRHIPSSAFNLSGVVHTTGNQSVQGVKTFKDTLKVQANLIQGLGTSIINGNYSTVSGFHSKVTDDHANAEGRYTQANYKYSHAEGVNTRANGEGSHAEGFGGTYQVNSDGEVTHDGTIGKGANGRYSHSEGRENTASADYSHAEGIINIANSEYSHAEGKETTTNGSYSHTEGEGTSTETNAIGSHAEGFHSTTNASYSHAEGNEAQTGPGGDYAHAEGQNTLANGFASHAEGKNTEAIARNSHAEGLRSITNGDYSHAEGEATTTNGYASHASGKGTVTNIDTKYQFAMGHFNIDTPDAIGVIGNGDGDGTRSNLVEFYNDSIVFNQPVTFAGGGSSGGCGCEVPDHLILENPTCDTYEYYLTSTSSNVVIEVDGDTDIHLPPIAGTQGTTITIVLKNDASYGYSDVVVYPYATDGDIMKGSWDGYFYTYSVMTLRSNGLYWVSKFQN